jgi:DNA primase
MVPKKKLEEIKTALNGAATIYILQHCGYEFYRGNKFKLRPEERSPSASVRSNDGYIKDFGGDFSGDLIDLLREYHNMSFEEAVQYVAICLGVTL